MNHLIVHTDGGARGNPGPAAIGFTIHHGPNLLFKHGEYIGPTTNNVAEYTAVIHALKWLQQYLQATSHKPQAIDFFLDSSLVVNQLQGKFKIKQTHLIPLHLQIRHLLQALPYRVSFHHIPRLQNSLADSLVNMALDKRPLSRLELNLK